MSDETNSIQLIPQIRGRVYSVWRKKGSPKEIDYGFFFIGGTPRSGTTLLQNIICNDRRLNPLIPEGAPLRFLLEAYRKCTNHDKKFPQIYFDEKNGVLSYFSGMIQRK